MQREQAVQRRLAVVSCDGSCRGGSSGFRWLLAVWLGGVLFFCSAAGVSAQNQTAKTAVGDRQIADYFAVETAKLRDASLADVKQASDWLDNKAETRRQLLEMLGLDPLPERTDLQVTITGQLDHPEFTVENLHFQSRPGLYVTGNLYVPKNLSGPVPAILYVCGHARVVKDGVSLGGKAHYQHHGGWFARNGYVCLIIDTLQLGEIEGIHHGTYRYNRWWWLSRGYCPAGVEAWNCVRALDYLQSRPEVNPEKLGVTGRSGGGAYSWWISAIDDRIQAAVPVAGITDLENHVVDGCVEGHCDCMYMVNTYRWDYPQVAALNFPRPLLFSNTDRDRIFPLDGVYRTYSRVRRLYELDKRGDIVALNITAGGHLDTQELQIHAMRWFDKHLRNDVRLIQNAAEKLFEPESLRVFEQIPADQLNTTIDETFVPRAATPSVPKSAADWQTLRDDWQTTLAEKTFRGWPTTARPLDLKTVQTFEKDGLTVTQSQFVSQDQVPLSLYVVQRQGLEQADLIVLNPLDQPGWEKFAAMLAVQFGDLFPENKAESNTAAATAAEDYDSLKKMLTAFPWAMAYVAPRGVGPTLWNQTERNHTQIQRRFYLLGQTWEGMQTYDIRRAMQAVRAMPSYQSTPLWLQGTGKMGVLAAYASLFEPPVKRIDLHQLPVSHEPDGPALLNVLKTLDIPQALALAAERSTVVVYESDPAVSEFAVQTASALKWPEKQVQVRPKSVDPK